VKTVVITGRCNPMTAGAAGRTPVLAQRGTLSWQETNMLTRTTIVATGLALGLAIGAGAAFAQSSTAPSASGQSAGPPTTGSNQGVNPPNATPGSATSSTPGSHEAERVPTTNPGSDGRATTVK
jgi:hypothetical protein